MFSNKVRSFLTMLGVATGIFAISAILTLFHSMQSTLTENLSAMGNTTMFVHNWPWRDVGEDWFKFFNRPKVSYRDYQQLSTNLKNVAGVTFEVSARSQTVKAEGRSMSGVEALGVTADYAKLTGLELSEGRFFSEFEIDGGAPVCIIGANIAESLFPNESEIVGKYVRLGGSKMKVVGLIMKKGSAISFGGSDDDRLITPYLFSAKHYNLSSRGIDKLILVKAKTHELLDETESEIIGIMRTARGLKPTQDDNFSVNKQEMLMKQIDQIFQYMEFGGWVVTFFSLLIGGFSIFNIMYISVKERTNEIGIQKALGSTRGFIMHQFMTESILICLLGGLLGLLFLLGFAQLVEQLLMNMGVNMHILIDWSDIVRALGLSLTMGVVAGAIPAGMAASVDPVIAIRAV